MLVIFLASTDLGSHQRTGRILGPLLRWIYPDISDAGIKTIQAVVRKSGHVIEYALLALLWWRARRMSRPGQGWAWREFWIVVVCCAAYAISDELHQHFVSTRQASPWDVLLDTAGAAGALLVLWRAGIYRRRW
jgi:VanZ family protein